MRLGKDKASSKNTHETGQNKTIIHETRQDKTRQGKKRQDNKGRTEPSKAKPSRGDRRNPTARAEIILSCCRFLDFIFADNSMDDIDAH